MAVVKLQVELVELAPPLLESAYHSYSVLPLRPDHATDASEPDGTVTLPIRLKSPVPVMSYGRSNWFAVSVREPGKLGEYVVM